MTNRALGFTLKQVTVAPVKNIKFSFDPFHQRVRSIRQVLFMLSAEKVQDTNPKFAMKVDVKSDRSDPVMKVNFSDGQKVLFKTENLTSLEILKKFNELCSSKLSDNNTPQRR